MSAERDPYSRVYWSILDDPKFADVVDDDCLLATWVRLLIVADMAWPASAWVPDSVDHDAVIELVEVGLVDRQPGGRFRIHGLDAERERRSSSARNAAASRWHSDRNATAPKPALLDKPSKDEQSKAEHPAQAREEATAPAGADPDAADTYWSLTGRYPGDKVLAWVDRLAGEYGHAAVSAQLAAAHVEDRDSRTLLGRAEDRLRRDARVLDLRAQAAERERTNARRAARPAVDPQAAQAALRELMGVTA